MSSCTRALCLLATIFAFSRQTSSTDWNTQVDYERCPNPTYFTNKNHWKRSMRKPKCRLFQLPDGGNPIIYRLNPKTGSQNLEKMFLHTLKMIYDGSPNFKRIITKQAGAGMRQCDHPDMAAARKTGAFEFSGSREPIDRFISGYFYAHRHDWSPTKKRGVDHEIAIKSWLANKTAHASQLQEFLAYIVAAGDTDWHMYPQTAFFCVSCLSGGEYDIKDNCNTCNQGVNCLRTTPVDFVLPLKNFTEKWPHLISRAFQGHDRQAEATSIASKVAIDYSLRTTHQNQGKERNDDIFTQVLGDSSYTVTANLCKYLKSDYDIMPNYEPLSICAL